MTFKPEQVEALKAPLHSAHVKSRAQAGRNLSYIEAWWAISEANRIFGYDGWTRETVELRQLGEPRLIDGKWRVGYSAKVRITVWAGERTIVREGCGFGSGIDKDLDQAHESALKEAESDAMKRGLMTFGNPFGLALYDKTQAGVTNARPVHQSEGVTTGAKLASAQLAGALNGGERKSSAAAKRDGDDAVIKADIAKLDAAGLFDWRENFDNYTAHLPVSWLDSIRNMLELREEELTGETRVAEDSAALDAGFRAAAGGGPSRLAGADVAHQAHR